MEFEEVVGLRRSIRKYLPQAVDAEQVEKLLNCARLCQSGKNRQNWSFMTLTGEEKDQVADIMLSLFDQKDVVLPDYVNTSITSANVIKEASLLILAFMDRSQESDWLHSDLLSMGAAIEHICLEAVNLGLGALWIRDTIYTQDEICKVLGQETLWLVSAIAVGYAAQSPKPRPRKTLEEILL